MPGDVDHWARAWTALFPLGDEVVPGLRAELFARAGNAMSALASAIQAHLRPVCATDRARLCEPHEPLSCAQRLAEHAELACRQVLAPSLLGLCAGDLPDCDLATSVLACLESFATSNECSQAVRSARGLERVLPAVLQPVLAQIQTEAQRAQEQAEQSHRTVVFLGMLLTFLVTFLVAAVAILFRPADLRRTNCADPQEEKERAARTVYNDMFVRLLTKDGPSHGEKA